MTFTEKKATITTILNSCVKEYPLEKDIAKFVEDYMVEYHTNVDSLTIHTLWIERNKTYKHNNFYYNGILNGEVVTHRLLGTSSVSSKKQLDMVVRRLNQAMREAISMDLYEYKMFILNNHGQESCNICGELFENIDKIHVDHCGEKEFRHIKDEFLSCKPNLIVQDRDENDAGLTKLVDNIDKELWIEFHHHSCELQLICQKCNLSKEKK